MEPKILNTDLIKINTIKRLYCTAALFLTAFVALSTFGKHSFESSWSTIVAYDLQQKDWMKIAVFVTVLISGWFFLPRYIGWKRNMALLTKPAIGFAVSTYFCAVSFLTTKSIYQITVDKYDERYGASLVTDMVSILFFFAPLGVIITLPFWLIGGLITQLVWLHFMEK